MSAVASGDLTELAAKLQRYLLCASLESVGDVRNVEELLSDGIGQSANTINEPLFQRWVIYLSAAVRLRYRRLDWLKLRGTSATQRYLWKNVVDQSDLAVLSLCETFFQLLPIDDNVIWADGFSSFMRSNAFGNIATHLLLFREAGFDVNALSRISCELLFVVDLWLFKMPESCMSEETIAQLTTVCAELLRYPESVSYFLKAAQLSEVESPDRLSVNGGLEFLFTSSYQLFPLFPMPITKLFSSCASSGKDGATVVRSLFSSMGCFSVQLPCTFYVTSVMQVSHSNDCAKVQILQPWKPPGGLHLVLPAGTTGVVLSHWPENGAIQRILFTHTYNAFDWFAAVTSSVASDAVQLEDGTVLDLLAEIAKLFYGLAQNLDISVWYDTNFSIVGPFSRLAPCLNAIRESPNLVRQVVTILASVIKFFSALSTRCPEEVAVIVDEYWAPVLLGGLYGELLSTYECRFADFQITSAICTLMSSFLETKYFEWMYGETFKKNLVALLDSFLHTSLANVATWRFTYLKKRIDHLRNIYALAALIFDVHSFAANKCLDSFSNLFIIDPLLNHISNSLPSKVIDFILSVADSSSASSFSFQQKLVQPSLQSLISAFLSCMLRLYRFISTDKNMWDVVSSIAIGSADLARAVILLLTSSGPSKTLNLTENNRRLCFDLVSLIISVLGHSLSLSGLLSLTERKQFQAVIIDTVSGEEKYVTTESAGNPRLLLIQSTMGLVESVMQFQPAFFVDLSARIRPIVMSVINRLELYQSLPSLYHASLRVIAAAWRYGRHQNFAQQLVEDSGQQNFWASVVYPLEVDVTKDAPTRKPQILTLLSVFDILSLEMFNFCRSGTNAGLNNTLVIKLTPLLENGIITARLESIFDYLLLNDEDGEYFPTSATCIAAASCVKNFVETLASCKLPTNLLKPRQQLEIIDSYVSVCIDLLTDLRSITEATALRRTVALSRVLLPSFLSAVLVMVRNWAKAAFVSSSRTRAVVKANILNTSGAVIFSKCIELCRMVLSAASYSDELPIRFDEPGILSLTLVAELLMLMKEDASLASECQMSFNTLCADVVTQLLATESDNRVASAFYSAALAVINALLLDASETLPTLLENEIFICKLIECTAKAVQEDNLSIVNIDALMLLVNLAHSINTSSMFDEQRQLLFSTRRILSSLSNAFHSHTFLECVLSGSQPGASPLQRTAASCVIDILTAMVMHADGQRNFFLNVDTICTFLAIYHDRFVKLAAQLTPTADALHFSICFSWARLIERVIARLSLNDQAVYQSADLSLTEIIRVLFMNAFVLLNNFSHCPLISADHSEDEVLRMCSCTLSALLRVSPSLVHIMLGDIFRFGRQVTAVVEADFSLVSLGSSSPKHSRNMRSPLTLTFGFLFACFHTCFRRLRRPSDCGNEALTKQHQMVDHGTVASILHSLLQLTVSQAVLHLQLLSAASSQYAHQTSSCAAAVASFDDQLKAELSACFVRFRRYLSSLPTSTLSTADVEDYQSLITVYEQLICNS